MFGCSSTVEHLAVNQVAAGSNPAARAKFEQSRSGEVSPITGAVRVDAAGSSLGSFYY